MIIIGIETSSRVGGVALADAGRLLGEKALPSGERHSATLLPAIVSLLGDCGIGRDEMGGISVGIGPGSFTGLRMGIATAQGLAVSLKIPLRGVSSMDLLVADYSGEAGRLCPVLNAHSYGLYASLYEKGQDGFDCVREPFVCRPAELASMIEGDFHFLGPDLDRFRGPLGEAFGERASFDGKEAYPKASTAALLFDSPRAVRGDKGAEVSPIYILPGVRKRKAR